MDATRDKEQLPRTVEATSQGLHISSVADYPATAKCAPLSPTPWYINTDGDCSDPVTKPKLLLQTIPNLTNSSSLGYHAREKRRLEECSDARMLQILREGTRSTPSAWCSLIVYAAAYDMRYQSTPRKRERETADLQEYLREAMVSSKLGGGLRRLRSWCREHKVGMVDVLPRVIRSMEPEEREMWSSFMEAGLAGTWEDYAPTQCAGDGQQDDEDGATEYSDEDVDDYADANTTHDTHSLPYSSPDASAGDTALEPANAHDASVSSATAWTVDAADIIDCASSAPVLNEFAATQQELSGTAESTFALA